MGTAPRGRSRNLCVELLDSRLDALADRPALDGPATDAWTYGDLSGRVIAAAARLDREGVRSGDIVVLCMPDSPEWVATFLALARLGAVTALASPRTSAETLGEATARLGARFAVTESEAVVCDRRLASAAFLVDAGTAPPPSTRENDACYLLLTSGSSGRPKWAVHRHRDILACVATYGRRVIALRPGDVTASVASLSTSYGLGNSCYFPIGAGASAWIDPDPPDPARLAAACRDRGVTCVFGVPTFWARLARHAAQGRVDRADLSGVRLAVSAGEPLPEAVWRAVQEDLGLALVNGLGSSEATNLYLSDRPGRPRPGTVGWPVAGYAHRVVGSDGVEVAAGEEGELWVRGPTLMPCYFDDDVATARTLVDGWLRTGDLVVRERDGSYSFRGRAGDRFKVGASWVDPQRVLACVLDVPGVGEAVVTGAPDPDGLTRVVAVVAADGPVAGLAERVVRRCADRLSHEETPRVVVVLDELPTTPNGKVRRAEVAAIAADALSGCAPPSGSAR